MSENAPVSGSGWVCAKCGAPIPAGDYHICGLRSSHEYPSANPLIDPKFDRIVRLLEQILEQLRRIG